MKPWALALLALPLLAQRKEVPEFIAGDQCLFCHRNDIGPAWGKNARQHIETHFSIASMMQRYEDVYRNLLTKNNR